MLSQNGKKKEKHQYTKNVASALSSLALHSTVAAGAVCGINQFMKKSRQESIKRKRVDEDDHDPMMRYVDENIIGNDVIYDGPFGPRKGILHFILSDYFFFQLSRERCLPFFENKKH